MEVEFTKFSGSVLLEVLAILTALALVLLALLRSRKPSEKDIKEDVRAWLEEKEQ